MDGALAKLAESGAGPDAYLQPAGTAGGSATPEAAAELGPGGAPTSVAAMTPPASG
jgi:hypothetical protein